MKGNMIKVHKIMCGREKLAQSFLFTLSDNTRTRGHYMKLNLKPIEGKKSAHN